MSETPERSGAAVRIPPPIIPLVALGAGLAAPWLFGPLPTPVEGGARFVIGAECAI